MESRILQLIAALPASGMCTCHCEEGAFPVEAISLTILEIASG